MKLADILIPQDKANHVIDGALIYLVVASVAKLFGVPAHREIGLLASVAVGAAKELYDWVMARRALALGATPTHTADPLDFLATSLGGLAVYAAGEL